jgi:hypothetical protein
MPRNSEKCPECCKVLHHTFQSARRVARNTRHNNQNDKRHFRPYRCRCGWYVVGTGDMFYTRSDLKLKKQRKEERNEDI